MRPPLPRSQQQPHASRTRTVPASVHGPDHFIRLAKLCAIDRKARIGSVTTRGREGEQRVYLRDLSLIPSIIVSTSHRQGPLTRPARTPQETYFACDLPHKNLDSFLIGSSVFLGFTSSSNSAHCTNTKSLLVALPHPLSRTLGCFALHCRTSQKLANTTMTCIENGCHTCYKTSVTGPR